MSVSDLKKDSLKFLLHYTQTYGDIVHYRAESWLVILVNHPNYIKHVLQEKHHNYTKEGTPDLMMLKPMLGEGLMTSEGDSWFQQRRLIQPAFHRERIEAFSTTITDATQSMLQQWKLIADRDKPLEIAEEMTRLTLQVVAQVLFGVDLNCEADNFGQSVGVINECMAHFDPNNQDQLREFREAMTTLNRLVYKIIQERRCQNEDKRDLLSMMMLATDEKTQEKMSDRHLQEQIFTLLMAGHETTAKALTWTLYLLDQHPVVAKQLQDELATVLKGRIPTYQDLPNLTYTWMVIQESMRLYTPVWMMSRLCRADDEIGGYHIPANALVLISPYAMHRHPGFWQEPEQFNPERFRPEAVAERLPYTYLPFSGGQRQCIGLTLARVETHLVLATLAQQYQLRLIPDHAVEPEALVTLRPHFGLPMTVHSL
ncbi:cytochrome P450 [Cylindrospermum sp. FACHB-282]|uniref:cytochrome P450 n=1 Tax=Cylindrospermum sp. FACHB-282 TaxID=2692794 RepID=UPI0016854A55|nr:cytochrome P450 [Cylindrospermum sp. FACHB-282]MBD2385982.1 cytochrome P450 [Cylindrospermum sp. FACHB-282]